MSGAVGDAPSVGLMTNAVMYISTPSSVSENIWANLFAHDCMSDVDILDAPRYKTSPVPMARMSMRLPLINGSRLRI